MVLKVDQFRIHHSFKKTLSAFIKNPSCEIRMDSAFSKVIQNCALRPPKIQSASRLEHSQPSNQGHPEPEELSGTWILPQIQTTYCAANREGFAHSVETWIDGVLVGGLYCVSLGKAVYGESMFSLQKDTSKIALAALVAFCKTHQIVMIDCQQNTSHLASLGAREMPRSEFIESIKITQTQVSPTWTFKPEFWRQLSV